MNPSTPQSLYQQYQKTPPASYENTIDPYRRHKSQPSESNSLEQEILHSRTASDSSTSRLAVNGAFYSHGLSTRDYEDDPYAMSRAPHHTSTTINSNNNDNNNSNNGNNRCIPTVNNAYLLRANSYLPYSHHQRDPAQPIAPIYVEDEQQQTFQGVGSMLQDNFSMDITQSDIQRPKGPPDTEKRDMEVLEQHEKKHRRRYCGLTLRIWICLIACFLALFTLLMYFLVPRMPTVKFTSADTTQQNWTNEAQTLTAQWIVNFTLDNSENWIPTWMQKMVVALEDKDTKTPIGWGALESQWIPPRHGSYPISIPINITYSNTDSNDETISDLKTTCGPRPHSPAPTVYQPELLFNATFQIDFYLQGVPRSSHTTIVPDDGIQCST